VKGFGIDGSGEIYVLGDGAGGGQALKMVAIPAAPALVNLSTRLRVETGENVGIAGFILTGSAPKNIAVRAIGPSLNVNGQPVPGRMSNPTLTIFDANGGVIGANDNWMESGRRQELVDRGLAPSDERESAEVLTLQPGAHTAVMQGVNGESGVGLIELYDIETGAPANAANISTRGRVQTADNVMIGGFIIGGTQPQRIIVRGIGPSLGARGVTGALQDPTLDLVDSSGTLVGSNDNWRSDQATDITNSGLAPADDRESAIIRTLNPGSYTAIVRGANGTTGVALVEVYRLNP
jgi:hypothetical protein